MRTCETLYTDDSGDQYKTTNNKKGEEVQAVAVGVSLSGKRLSSRATLLSD